MGVAARSDGERVNVAFVGVAARSAGEGLSVALGGSKVRWRGGECGIGWQQGPMERG